MEENLIRKVKLLVVSRDSSVLSALLSAGDSNCWQIEIAADAWDAVEKVRSGISLDIILLDLAQEYGDGLQIMRTLRRFRPALPVILVGLNSDVARKQEAIRMGACEYLTRPLERHELEEAILHNLSTMDEEVEVDITGDDVEPLGNGSFFIGSSPAMRRLRAQVGLLAEIDLPVFIFGEPGSGKETIARLLHRLSIRSGFNFVKVNCAALPEELLEREIFGSEAGGSPLFPKSRLGKFELCDKGTVFLDEITEMPLRLQSRLVQFLQSGQFVKKGTSESVNLDVRVVAASTKSLDQAVSEHKLLVDLSRQLDVYELQVPALRHRKEELPVLSRHFMHRLARHYDLQPRDFSPEVYEVWATHEWPGNLRELEQSVKRYLMVGDRSLGFQKISQDIRDETGSVASSKQGSLPARTASRQSEGAGICGYKSLRALLQSVKGEAERNAIAFALEKTGWNRKAAARLLKTSYRTVLYKIEQYQLSIANSSLYQVAGGFEYISQGMHGDLRADPKVADLPGVASGRHSER